MVLRKSSFLAVLVGLVVLPRLTYWTCSFADPDGHIIECVYMPKEQWEGKE
jgi:hypothetical protein